MVMGTKTPQGARLNPQNTLELSQGMSIQTAINTADAHGGNWTILLYPGAVYNEGDLTPNGGANITIKGMGEGRVIIAPTLAPAIAVIVSGFTLNIEDIIITAPGNTRPALRVTGGTCETCDCEFNGVGTGDAIQMVAGTLLLNDCDVPVGDVDLSTAGCTLTAIDSNFDGTIDTAGAVAHTITMFSCDLGGQTLNLAATGACAYTFHNCMSMSTITDASLLGTGHLCQCDVVGAGLVVNGTSAWIVDNAGLAAVSNTNAAAAVAIYGGINLAITRAVGSVVWWLDNNTLKVIPSGTITDTVIQWAVNAAGAGDTIVIHPGTYEEAVTLAAGINLVGVDKEQCVINIDHAVLITMAAGCRVANLTLDATCDATNVGTGIELNDAACTIEDINIVLHRPADGAYATGILESTGATARTIYIRNVRCRMSDDTNERGIAILQAGKTVYVEECWIQGSDYGLAIGASGGAAVASTIYTTLSHFEATSAVSRSVFCNGGTIRMNGCNIGGFDHSGGRILRENDGIVTLKTGPRQYEVWFAMSPQDAIDAAAAETATPAATDPYTVLIHPGIYDEAIACVAWVNLKGVGPKGAVVLAQTDANIVTLATNVELQNLTLRVVTPTAARYLIIDNDAACTVKLSELVLEITTPDNLNHQLIRLTGTGTYTIERCSYRIAAGTGVVYGVANLTNAAVKIYLIQNDCEITGANASHIYSAVAGSWEGGGNRWAGTCHMWNVAAGAITLDKDAIVCTGSASGDVTGGTVVCRTGEHSFEVYEGMEILHAIAAGRYIYVHPGTYTVTASIAIAVSNLTIQGSGRQTIITTATDNLDIFSLNGGAGSELTNIILRDFTVRGFLTGAMNDLGIWARWVDYSKFINLWIENNGESGAWFNDFDNNEVEGCHFTNNNNHGILIVGTWVKLVGCVAYDNVRDGIRLDGGHDCSIIAATCKGNDSGNTNTYDGISLTGSNRVAIESAQCDANDRHGLYIHESSNCSITGGQFNNNTQGDGIHIAGDDPNADYNIITGVVATGNGSDGIEISEVGAGDSNKNIVIGCQLLGNGGNPLTDGGTNTEAAHNIVA